MLASTVPAPRLLPSRCRYGDLHAQRRRVAARVDADRAVFEQRPQAVLERPQPASAASRRNEALTEASEPRCRPAAPAHPHLLHAEEASTTSSSRSRVGVSSRRRGMALIEIALQAGEHCPAGAAVGAQEAADVRERVEQQVGLDPRLEQLLRPAASSPCWRSRSTSARCSDSAARSKPWRHSPSAAITTATTKSQCRVALPFAERRGRIAGTRAPESPPGPASEGDRAGDRAASSGQRFQRPCGNPGMTTPSRSTTGRFPRTAGAIGCRRPTIPRRRARSAGRNAGSSTPSSRPDRGQRQPGRSFRWRTTDAQSGKRPWSIHARR